MPELELVIFDLAGTTIEDRGQVPASFTAALAEHGFEVTSEQVKGVRGSSKRQALLNLIPAGLQQTQRLKKFMPRSARTWRDATHPMEFRLSPARSRLFIGCESAAFESRSTPASTERPPCCC